MAHLVAKSDISNRQNTRRKIYLARPNLFGFAPVDARTRVPSLATRRSMNPCGEEVGTRDSQSPHALVARYRATFMVRACVHVISIRCAFASRGRLLPTRALRKAILFMQ